MRKKGKKSSKPLGMQLVIIALGLIVFFLFIPLILSFVEWLLFELILEEVIIGFIWNQLLYPMLKGICEFLYYLTAIMVIGLLVILLSSLLSSLMVKTLNRLLKPGYYDPTTDRIRDVTTKRFKSTTSYVTASVILILIGILVSQLLFNPTIDIIQRRVLLSIIDKFRPNGILDCGGLIIVGWVIIFLGIGLSVALRSGGIRKTWRRIKRK